MRHDRQSMQVQWGEGDRAEALAEAERIQELSPTELAVEVMRAFGPDGHPYAHRSGEASKAPAWVRWVGLGAGGLDATQVCYWLMRNYRRGFRQRNRLLKPVARSLQVLADAGLIENVARQRFFGALVPSAAQLRATPLGEKVLAERAVERYV